VIHQNFPEPDLPLVKIEDIRTDADGLVLKLGMDRLWE
jgi:hypothetical protein